MFLTGDKVMSDKYGPGIVTGPSSKAGGVRVDFKGGRIDNVYHHITGERLPICGTDVITKMEDET